MTYWLVQSSVPFFPWLRHSWLIVLSMNLQTPRPPFARTCQHLQRPLFQLPFPEKLSQRPWTLGITFLLLRWLPSPWHVSLISVFTIISSDSSFFLSSLFQLVWSGWNRRPLSILSYKHNWGNDSTYSLGVIVWTDWMRWQKNFWHSAEKVFERISNFI